MTKIKEVEKILKSYLGLISTLKMLQATIPNSSPIYPKTDYSGMPGGGEGLKSIPESVATKELNHTQNIAITERKICVIQAALDSLTARQRTIVELKYFYEWNDTEIGEHEKVDRHPRTVKRIREVALERLIEANLVVFFRTAGKIAGKMS